MQGPVAAIVGALTMLATVIGGVKMARWIQLLRHREAVLAVRVRRLRKQRDRARKAEVQLREVVRTLLSEHHLEDRIERLQRSVENAPNRARPRILTLVRDAAETPQHTPADSGEHVEPVLIDKPTRSGSRIPVDDTLARLVLRGSLARPDTIS